MLRLRKRHESTCKYTSEVHTKCQCNWWIKGTDALGHSVRRSAGTGSLEKAKELLDLLWDESVSLRKGQELARPPLSVSEAIERFLATKAKHHSDTVRNYRKTLERFQAFCTRHHLQLITAITLDHLIAFRNTWTFANSTQRKEQEQLRGFFRYLVNAEHVRKNPAAALPPIPNHTDKKVAFSDEELARIFNALDDYPNAYRGVDASGAKQLRAFVYVMRYTGLSIGDTMQLPRSAVEGTRVLTKRKKNGNPVYCDVPPFVIDSLNDIEPASETYFFWSGQSTHHTRASNWNRSLNRLFRLAKITGKTPHHFRHTLVRDLLRNGVSLEEVASLLGHSTIATVQKYYSNWDVARQETLSEKLKRILVDDPFVKLLRQRDEFERPPSVPIH